VDVININKLYKNFGKKEVLKDINLNVEEGKIYGLFGKNGAGKTTLIKIILGLYFPTSGEVYVFGKNPSKGGMKEIGYLSENLAGYFELSAYDNIDIVAKMQGIKLRREEIFQILNMVKLKEAAEKRVKDFSLGMKRRLQLTFALCLGEKRLIILDEPTNGLDIEGVAWFKGKIKEMKKEGKTIFISTHAFREAEDIIDEFIIIHKGEIKKRGCISELKSKNKKLVEVRVEDVIAFESLLNSLRISFVRKHLSGFIVEEKENVNLIEEMVKRKIEIQRLETYKESLEQIFETLTKE